MRAFLLVVVYVVQGAVLQMRCVSINESSNGGGNPQVLAVRLRGYAGVSESWLLCADRRMLQDHTYNPRTPLHELQNGIPADKRLLVVCRHVDEHGQFLGMRSGENTDLKR